MCLLKQISMFGFRLDQIYSSWSKKVDQLLLEVRIMLGHRTKEDFVTNYIIIQLSKVTVCVCVCVCVCVWGRVYRWVGVDVGLWVWVYLVPYQKVCEDIST